MFLTDAGMLGNGKRMISRVRILLGKAFNRNCPLFYS
jgi:hypothetical protein